MLNHVNDKFGRTSVPSSFTLAEPLAELREFFLELVLAVCTKFRNHFQESIKAATREVSVTPLEDCF